LARISGIFQKRCPGTIVRGTKPVITRLIDSAANMASAHDFESIVTEYYQSLYQFAFSLVREEAEACDLTQQTFYIWATKGHQLRDASKVKTWLFTTLHRQFLESRRRQTRFPHHELESMNYELPVVPPTAAARLDSAQVIQALSRVDEVYQAPVALFYLEEYAYKEIAEILEIPIGTVKSRISRGIGQLQKLLTDPQPGAGQNPSHD
jgi:RNA polymerase sigma-70 factor, ECF subfamily